MNLTQGSALKKICDLKLHSFIWSNRLIQNLLSYVNSNLKKIEDSVAEFLNLQRKEFFIYAKNKEANPKNTLNY